ncbi:hypothetical protein ILUMI_01523, partial [Ignelater luminosus]
EKWIHDPFAAEIDEKGNIYGRGAQDMKCVSIEYLEAIHRLKKANVTLRRTVHLSFVSAMQDHCPGQTGHSSVLLPNTAREKMMLDKFCKFREQEKKKLENNPSLTLGDVTTVNVTMVQGGVHMNVIPSEFIVSIDCRISPTLDIAKFEKTLKRWCEEAGEGVWIEFEAKEPQTPASRLDDSNPFWVAFKKASDNIAATDSRYIRELGIPAIGFSPINNTPVLLHDHNEYLNKDVFLRDIEIYCKLIPAIANVET